MESLTALFAALIFASQIRGMLDIFPPIGIAYQKWAFSKYPVNIPTIMELVEQRYKKLISEEEYLTRAKENGFDVDIANNFYKMVEQYLPIGDYITLFRRGELNEEKLNEKLSLQHFSQETIQQAIKATEYFPSAPDLVRFAVREVFTPATAEKFGQYQELPQQFLDLAKKAGLPEQVAKWYWAAHWELPSANMGYEMFQRRIIDKDTLIMLLKSLDVMPYWQDKLVQLSYNVVTRVDTRRLFDTGIWDKQQVYNSYLDMGYSPTNAGYLTDYTCRDSVNEKYAYTKTMLEKEFKENYISLEQFKQYLVDMNYDPNSLDMYIQIIEHEKMQDDTDNYVKEITAQFNNGLISIDEVSNQLSKYNLPASFISATVAKLKASKSVKAKLPTREDLTNWLNLGIIDGVTFGKRMLSLGYTSLDTEYYMSEIAQTKDIKTVKYLPIKTYVEWASAGIITSERVKEIMTIQKYSVADINAQLLQIQQAVKG